MVCEGVLAKEEPLASADVAEPTYGVEGARPEEAERIRVEGLAVGLRASVACRVVGPKGNSVVVVGAGGDKTIAGEP